MEQPVAAGAAVQPIELMKLPTIARDLAARLCRTLADLRQVHASLKHRCKLGAPPLPDSDLVELWGLDYQVESLATRLGIPRPDPGHPVTNQHERGWTRICYEKTNFGLRLADKQSWYAGIERLAALASGIEAEAPPLPDAVHNADFTMVRWFGTEHHFALGVQSSAVRTLWEEWERTGLGLHQETIREVIDAERDNFRIDNTFRNHKAFGTMIQRLGDGRYGLVPPNTEPVPSTRSTQRNTRNAPKSRRKRA
jgi:hypothetical protein